MDTEMKVDRAPVTCRPARTDLPSLKLLLLVKPHAVAVVFYLKSELLSRSPKPLTMKPTECESKLVDAEGAGDVDGDDVEEDGDFSGEEGDHNSKGNDNSNIEKNHLKGDGDDDEDADDASNGQDDDDDDGDDDEENSEDEVEEEPDNDDEDEEDKDEEEDEDEEVQPPKKRKK